LPFLPLLLLLLVLVEMDPCVGSRLSVRRREKEIDSMRRSADVTRTNRERERCGSFVGKWAVASLSVIWPITALSVSMNFCILLLPSPFLSAIRKSLDCGMPNVSQQMSPQGPCILSFDERFISGCFYCATIMPKSYAYYGQFFRHTFFWYSPVVHTGRRGGGESWTVRRPFVPINPPNVWSIQ